MDNVVTRDVGAPTEAEARAMAAPVVDAFTRSGWVVREELWIPGDRRPGLGESLLLSPQSELLLEGNGTLHLVFANADAQAVPPPVDPAPRTPDWAEEIGGVRYRRLVPRWAIGAIVAMIGLLVVFSIASNMPNSPFSPVPTPDADGLCPFGWIAGPQITSDGVPLPVTTCQRLPNFP